MVETDEFVTLTVLACHFFSEMQKASTFLDLRNAFSVI